LKERSQSEKEYRKRKSVLGRVEQKPSMWGLAKNIPMMTYPYLHRVGSTWYS